MKLFLTGRAQAKELKKVPPNLEAGRPGKPLFQLLKVTISKVNHRTAFRANQVMMVPDLLPHEIAPATAPGMHLADEPQFSQYRQGTVDGNQPDSRIFPTHPVMYRCRGKVARAFGDHLEHRPTLRGKPVTLLP